MKVYIGPDKNYIGPYQIADWFSFLGFQEEDREKIGDWLSDNKTVTKILNWYNDIGTKRKIEVRIDKYDSWNMDNTLAHIILPLLKQLKETKHGAPYVDPEDAPENIRAVSADEYNVDEFHFQRWDYVLGEMIWAFEQELDENADDKFWIPKTPEDIEKEIKEPLNILSDFGYKLDREALEKFESRKQNGFRLFGKYYQGLWD